MALFRIWNGPSPAATVQVAVATGTSLKTMLQVLGITGHALRVKAWGFSMDAAAAAEGVRWELCETGVVAATVTAHVEAGIVPMDHSALIAIAANYFNLGTEATGYTSSDEDTVTETRVFDGAFVQPTGERAWEFSLGNGREIDPIHVLRVRCIAPVDVDAICWVEIET